MNLVNVLESFINAEYDAQKAEVESTWKQPISQRVEQGEAIAEIEVVEVTLRSAKLRCVENLSKFRVGDTLCLSRDNPNSGPHYTCKLTHDNGAELIVVSGYGETFRNLNQSIGWTLDRAVVDTRHLLLKTLTDFTFLHNNLEAILLGNQQPQLNIERGQLAAEMATSLPLNSAQRSAFTHAFATDNFWLIQGPPGTGKTLLLAHLAAAFASEGCRVLVTAATHQAINNALLKIVQHTNCVRVAKIGDLTRSEGLQSNSGNVENYGSLENCPYRASDYGFILGASCFSTQSNQLQGIHFDVAIIDEASQLTIPLALAAMASADKQILIGDHCQLPPVIVAEHPNLWVTRSIFETLVKLYPVSKLDITYRMNEEINAIPSQRFYEGRLKCSKLTKDRKLALLHTPTRYGEIFDPDSSTIFVDLQHKNYRTHCAMEAKFIADLIYEVLQCGVLPDQIAVIAPFRAQTRMINHQLRAVSIDDTIIANIMVDTIERMQGQERELVIFSLTTSDTAYASEHAEFCFQPNRLNVAITRASLKRIVVGSSNLLKTVPAEKKHRLWVENFRRLYHGSRIIELSQAEF